MYVFICIYMYVCMYVYIYMYIYIYVFSFTHCVVSATINFSLSHHSHNSTQQQRQSEMLQQCSLTPSHEHR